ncbi:MAG: YlbF family regulator [Eubacterium sp.]|nr:YlbF family regulator [Eubacterium sp.]
MNLEKTLRELGKEIQADPRYVALKEAAAANDKDEELQKQMQELQLITLKYQQEMGKGDEADSEKLEELQKDYQKLYGELMERESMVNYSAAAKEVEEMAQYITGMMGLFFDGQDPETCEIPPADCTHNCATCGGC